MLKLATGFSLGLALVGCAKPVKCQKYTELGVVKEICQGSPEQIDAICAPGPVEDDGSSTKFRERVVRNSDGVGVHTEYADSKARWCPAKGTVLLAYGVSVETLLHELCHAATGLSRVECRALFHD